MTRCSLHGQSAVSSVIASLTNAALPSLNVRTSCVTPQDSSLLQLRQSVQRGHTTIRWVSTGGDALRSGQNQWAGSRRCRNPALFQFGWVTWPRAPGGTGPQSTYSELIRASRRALSTSANVVLPNDVPSPANLALANDFLVNDRFPQ